MRTTVHHYLHQCIIQNEIKKQINALFWTGNYYVDWIHKKPHNYLCTDGNVLAIIFDVADEAQSIAIQNQMKEFQMKQ